MPVHPFPVKLTAARVLLASGLVLAVGDVMLIRRNEQSVSSFLGKHLPELFLVEVGCNLHFMSWPQALRGFDPFRRVARQLRGQ